MITNLIKAQRWTIFRNVLRAQLSLHFRFPAGRPPPTFTSCLTIDRVSKTQASVGSMRERELEKVLRLADPWPSGRKNFWSTSLSSGFLFRRLTNVALLAFYFNWVWETFCWFLTVQDTIHFKRPQLSYKVPPPPPGFPTSMWPKLPQAEHLPRNDL